MNFSEKFIERNIAELCEEYDKIHGANINIARITPDLIDGLKPVHRRALYMTFLKDHGKKYRKVATISGETFGALHPHNTTAIDDAICALAQPWHNSIPLFDPDGNFGSIAGDRHGASRYIKTKLSDYAYACFFEDWKYSVVDKVIGADEETKEPLYLPAKYPNVLLNGTLGIGYGLSSNIPPFNFKEIVDACIQLMIDPNSKVVLIPDSPTGSDVLEGDFASICERGNGVYYMRCTYEIDDENNIITITSLPYQIYSNSIREKIADIKEKGGLPELLSMNDLSGKKIDIKLIIRDDVNPYKFMKKLIKEVPDLQKNYSINITVSNDYESIDYSIKKLILEWIKWRREQKRIVLTHKRSSLLAEQRTNDVKIFLLDGKNLEDTIKIFRSNHGRKEIEKKLIETYKNSEIRMDSLQARALSDMRLYELSISTHEACLKRREELFKELNEIEDTLNTENGIDKLIIAELREGVRRFGYPRRSNVVPWKISVSTKVDGVCILQLSSDGMIVRRSGTNVDEEPIPIDSNGFAVKVDNDSSFIVVDEFGNHSFIRVKELPVDTEVPIQRYKRPKDILEGNIIAMLPCDIDSNKCVTLISKNGSIKRMKISDLGPSKKPYMDLSDDDRIVKGIVTSIKSNKDLLVYTKYGMGQRLDPNSIRITSQNAKGGNGFKLRSGDEIIGCFTINPEENQYIVYVTKNGKMRLNLIDYLPIRDSKHDSMVKLISLNDRDKLVGVIGCNKLDKIQVFFDDETNEIVEVQHLEEGTMSSEPKKVTKKNAVSSNIVKVKLV